MGYEVDWKVGNGSEEVSLGVRFDPRRLSTVELIYNASYSRSLLLIRLCRCVA